MPLFNMLNEFVFYATVRENKLDQCFFTQAPGGKDSKNIIKGSGTGVFEESSNWRQWKVNLENGKLTYMSGLPFILFNI